MQHQCTQLPAGNYPRRKQTTTRRWKPQNHKTPEILTSWKPSDQQRPDVCHDKCTRCGDTLHAKDFNAQLRNSNVRCATNLVTSLLYVTRKVKANSPPLLFSQENPRHNKFKWGPYTPTMMPIRVNLTQKLKIRSAYR